MSLHKDIIGRGRRQPASKPAFGSSYEIMNHVMCDYDFPAKYYSVKQTLMGLVSYVNVGKNDYIVFPGNESLGKRACVSRRTAQRSIKILLDLGFIEVHEMTSTRRYLRVKLPETWPSQDKLDKLLEEL